MIFTNKANSYLFSQNLLIVYWFISFRYAFAVVYTLEMILKVLARGFVLHKHAYLRDPWNRLDFVVVMFG